MRPKVVGIAGHTRSGKTCAAEYLRSKYQAKVFRNSEPIGQVISNLKGAHDRKTYIDLSTALFEVFGNDMLAHHWLRNIGAAPTSQLYVVEGIRYLQELETYRASADFLLLGIKSSDRNRFTRASVANDSEKDRGRSYEEFLAQKQLRNESFVDSIVSQADRIIVNDGSMAEFTSLIDSAVTDVLKVLQPG